MPYKDKEKRKEAVKRYRDNKKGITGEGDTGDGITSHNDYSASQLDGTFFKDEYVPASYVPGSKGKSYLMLPERPRYLKLTDGQVLDRAKLPVPTGSLSASSMLRANDSAFALFKKRRLVPEGLKDKLVRASTIQIQVP